MVVSAISEAAGTTSVVTRSTARFTDDIRLVAFRREEYAEWISGDMLTYDPISLLLIYSALADEKREQHPWTHENGPRTAPVRRSVLLIFLSNHGPRSTRVDEN